LAATTTIIIPTYSISLKKILRVVHLFSGQSFLFNFRCRNGYMYNYLTLLQSCRGHALQKKFFDGRSTKAKCFNRPIFKNVTTAKFTTSLQGYRMNRLLMWGTVEDERLA